MRPLSVGDTSGTDWERRAHRTCLPVAEQPIWFCRSMFCKVVICFGECRMAACGLYACQARSGRGFEVPVSYKSLTTRGVR